MAGQKLIDQKLVRTRVGEELVAFGTPAAAFQEIQPFDSSNPALDQDNIKPQDSRAWNWADQPLGVLGLKKGEAELDLTARSHLAPLDSMAAPAESPSGLLLACILGDCLSAAGAVVASGTSTQITCATVAHAGRFSQLMWFSVVSGGVRYARQVMASDPVAGTIDFAPPLPLAGTPDVGTDVWNGRTYYVTQSNKRSMTLQQARQDAGGDNGHQVQLVGCNGDYAVTFELDKLVTWKTKLMSASWSGPDNSLGLLPAPVYSEAHGPGFLHGHTEVWFTEASNFVTAGAVHVPFSKIVPAFPGEVKRFTVDAGGLEGKGGIVRVAPEDGIYSTLDLSTTAYDPAWPAASDAGKVYACTVLNYSGSGATRRCNIHHWPGLEFAKRPVNTFADRMVLNQLVMRTVGGRTVSRAPLTGIVLAPYMTAFV